MTLKDNSRVLFINPFGIGDVLFTTALLMEIKLSFPQCFIGYWCCQRSSPVLNNNPHINKLFSLSRGDIKKIYRNSWIDGIHNSYSLYRDIKKCRFDFCFDFSLDHRYGLVAKFAGIKNRIGYNYKNRGIFLTLKKDISGYKDRHIVDYYLDLLSFVDIRPRIRKTELFISEENISNTKNLLFNLRVLDGDIKIGISPAAGASWGRDALLKHWPADKFGQLADKIIDEIGAKVILLGDSSEQDVCNKVLASMRNKPIDLTARLDLHEFISLVSKLDILITNDGGPLHIASALGVKTVSIFGPVDPKVYGPYPLGYGHNIVLRSRLDCSPCYESFRLKGCIRNKECLDLISVNNVYDAVNKLLSKRGEA